MKFHEGNYFQKVYEILEPDGTDFVDRYAPVSSQIRRPRPTVLYRRPIEERVTLPPPPQVVYVPVPVRNQRRGAVVRGRGRGVRLNQMTKNSVRGVINNAITKNRSAGPNLRGGRGGRRRGGMLARRGHYSPLPKKSISQLDRELDEYMRKSKHPKIVI